MEKLIAEVRTVYDGPVGYNCDKYGEDHITWWDAVDVIAEEYRRGAKNR